MTARTNGRWIKALGELQRRLLVDARRVDYWVAAIVGLVPIAVAWWTGRGHTVDLHPASEVAIAWSTGSRTVENGGAIQGVRGYFDCLNWMMYPVALPLALFLVRWLMRPILGGDARGDASSLRATDAYLPFRERFSTVASDTTVLVSATAINVFVQVFDAWEVIRRFAGLGFHPPACELDWCWFDVAAQPSGAAEYSRLATAALLICAYTCQFLLCGLAFLLPCALLKVNRRYLEAVYIRAVQKEAAKPRYELDFSAKDERFGLSGMSHLFNRQVIIAAAAGAFMLVSRYANTDVDMTNGVIEAAHWIVLISKSTPADLPDVPWRKLFHDPGQWMLGAGWCVMILVVALPVRLKTLPIGHLRRLPGLDHNAENYLRQFVRPGSAIDRRLDEDKAGVDEVADSFRRNHFWPNGDPNALWYFTIAILVFALILFPCKLRNGFAPFAVAMFFLVTASRVAAKLLIYTGKARLRRISPRLVDRPKAE